jgi:hypothetical protein
MASTDMPDLNHARLSQIATLVVASLPPDFSNATVTIKMIHRYYEAKGSYQTSGGDKPRSFLPDLQVEDEFAQLRISMAKMQPGKGAWYTAVIRIESDGRFAFAFDYERPAFEYTPSQDKWDEDEALYPRR